MKKFSSERVDKKVPRRKVAELFFGARNMGFECEVENGAKK